MNVYGVLSYPFMCSFTHILSHSTKLYWVCVTLHQAPRQDPRAQMCKERLMDYTFPPASVFPGHRPGIEVRLLSACHSNDTHSRWQSVSWKLSLENFMGIPYTEKMNKSTFLSLIRLLRRINSQNTVRLKLSSSTTIYHFKKNKWKPFSSWLLFPCCVVNPSSRTFSCPHFCIRHRLVSHFSSADVTVTQTLQNIWWLRREAHLWNMIPWG